MLNKERQLEILKLLKVNEAMSVKKLTELLFASEATIRRDLTELESDGQIRRVYGGAMLLIDSEKQVPLYAREKEHHKEKEIICNQALKIIENGSTLFIDGSSTSQILVKYLCGFRDLTVITNGLRIAQTLAQMQIKTLCTGGTLINNSYTFSGRQAERFCNDYNVDICFISCKGLNHEGVFSDTSENETALRRCVLHHSRKRVILLTSNKIGKTFLHTLCLSRDVDYIFCDKELPSGIETRSR